MEINVVDGADPELARGVVSDLGGFSNPALAAPDFAQETGAIILQDHGLNALRSMVDAIIRRAGRPGSIHLLRIYGHGSQGAQLVGGWEVFGIGPALSLTNLAFLRPTLRRIAPYFARTGRAYLMGCSVAAAPLGPMLLQGLADMWGVPVTAGKQIQYSGGGTSLDFEGPVVTAYPRRVGQWLDIAVG